MIITPELRQAVQESGSARIEDQDTGETYLITKCRDEAQETLAPTPHISEGIRKSKEAFARDLPELLKDKRNHKKWVAYHGDNQVMIHKDGRKVMEECWRLGLEESEFILDIIEPNALEPLEMDYPSSWL